ncbi:MAG: insulinase family protein, partial [Gemmatimonadetes bacterium]|nr:insulinase family protein [Gemmatimonadota bacterium]
ALLNGVPVLGVEDRETPLVQFELRLRGGSLLEDPSRVGAANLLATTLLEGTEQRTPEELEEAIDLLGASLSVRSGTRNFTISGSVLARNYPELMAIVEEVLLEPRFDQERFALAQQRVAAGLSQQETNPNAVAAWAFNRIAYGGHVLGENPAGTPESVASFTTDDLRAYLSTALVPELAAFHVAGALDPDEAVAPLQSLAARWTGGERPEFPAPPEWSPDRAGLYFIDIPGAVQSVVAVGRLALAETDPEFYPAQVMNYRLGGGGFASDLTQELREGKGYTYGIRSGFQGSDLIGPFTIQSSVRSNVTLESLALIKDLVGTHGARFVAEDLEVTQGFLLRSNARAFETLGAKLAVVRNVSDYGFEPSYVLDRQETVREMTVERVRDLAERYLDPESMIWLVVGDAATQRSRLDALGLGPSVALDRRGMPGA